MCVYNCDITICHNDFRWSTHAHTQVHTKWSKQCFLVVAVVVFVGLLALKPHLRTHHLNDVHVYGASNSIASPHTDSTGLAVSISQVDELHSLCNRMLSMHIPLGAQSEWKGARAKKVCRLSACTSKQTTTFLVSKKHFQIGFPNELLWHSQHMARARASEREREASFTFEIFFWLNPTVCLNSSIGNNEKRKRKTTTTTTRILVIDLTLFCYTAYKHRRKSCSTIGSEQQQQKNAEEFSFDR